MVTSIHQHVFLTSDITMTSSLRHLIKTSLLTGSKHSQRQMYVDKLNILIFQKGGSSACRCEGEERNDLIPFPAIFYSWCASLNFTRVRSSHSYYCCYCCYSCCCCSSCWSFPIGVMVHFPEADPGEGPRVPPPLLLFLKIEENVNNH